MNRHQPVAAVRQNDGVLPGCLRLAEGPLLSFLTIHWGQLEDRVSQFLTFPQGSSRADERVGLFSLIMPDPSRGRRFSRYSSM